MITAAVASMQARKLNYVEVEIVPKPSTGKKGEKPFIHITDVSVQYSTIIFPERDGKGTPHNSIVADDSLQVSCGIQEFEEGAQDVPPNLPMRDDQRSECKKHSGTATPPRRRRSHSSPHTPRGKKISSSERCEQIEECNSNENYKTRTLPSAEAPWHDDVFMVETPKNEETHQEKMAAERVERGKQDTPTRKMKKFFRTGRHASDLGATQDIMQAVQAMQKKVRRKSSGESGDSSSDLGYSSNSHEVGSVGASGSVPSHQETVPTSLRNPPPIPGSMRNTELEKAMTRRKLSKQNSIDLKKMKVEKKDVCSPVVSETKQRTKFLQIFPTMKFGKFGGSSSKSKEAKQEAKNQQIKKPVPLPRYNKNHPSPLNSCSESLDSTDQTPETILCESRVQEDTRGSEVEAETYVNVVFQQREGGHNYENVNLEEKSSSDHNLQHFTSAESYNHSRPLPAPRLNTPHLPIKDHKATPPDQKEDILSPSPKKRDLDSPRQTGYETVTYKPPCLQLYNEGFFPKHVGSSFEEDETTGSNEEYQSSCDEEATTRKREIEFLSLALKQDLSLSKEKRIKCDPPPKRNSDGSVRSVPEGWGGSEYAVFKQPEKEEHRSFHHKHIRSHSSGGQLVLFNSNITVLHAGEKVNQKGDKGEIRSADMFPIAKMDTFKPTQNSPPHHHGREPKRVPRTTHEHVTLGQHVHSSLHSSPLGGSPKEKELKYKYMDDAPSIQRSPQAGSPSRQGQTPDVPCLQRSPQAGSLSTQGQNPDVPCLQRSPQAGSPSTQGQTPWWDDNGEEDQLEEKPIPSYINQPWYYGKLLRQECDYLMISKGNPCQYLVRDSSHRAGGLMLCVLYGQKVHHYIIHVINDTEYQMAGHTFASVSEIIEFYRKHVIMYSPNQEPVFLGEPFLYPR